MSGLRTIGTWLLIAALVLCSTFSIKAHPLHDEHGTSALLALHVADSPPSGDDIGEAGELGCHCMCQHFGGVIFAASSLPSPDHPDAPLAVAAELGIPIPPATPLRPPKP